MIPSFRSLFLFCDQAPCTRSPQRRPDFTGCATPRNNCMEVHWDLRTWAGGGVFRYIFFPLVLVVVGGPQTGVAFSSLNVCSINAWAPPSPAGRPPGRGAGAVAPRGAPRPDLARGPPVRPLPPALPLPLRRHPPPDARHAQAAPRKRGFSGSEYGTQLPNPRHPPDR